MSENLGMSGKCLCGAVRFTAEFKEPGFGVCHCSMCRRWTGGPFMCIEAAGPPAITGAENVTYYQSSDWGTRGFCKNCGTSLWWRAMDDSHLAIAVGALDEPKRLTFETQIFVEEKPAFYDFANQTKMMTGAKVMAAMGVSPEGKDA